MKKGFSTFIYDENSSENPLLKSSNGSSKSNAVPCKDTYVHRVNQPMISFTAIPSLSCMDVSTSQSDNCSVSLDESMSTCDSLGSPEFEYMDKDGDLAVRDMSKRDTFEEIETDCEVGGVDDPQFCPTIACDTYQNLCVSEGICPRETHLRRLKQFVKLVVWTIPSFVQQLHATPIRSCVYLRFIIFFPC
ncbi:unnamed protein product [Ilex paraguariensis]|uniref:Uncharacterized protein n=1 Tax=Ilex paraguariensis TaxID=185542 RepID=A0ABC8TMB7_9AQUA